MKKIKGKIIGLTAKTVQLTHKKHINVFEITINTNASCSLKELKVIYIEFNRLACHHLLFFRKNFVTSISKIVPETKPLMKRYLKKLPEA